MHAFTNTYRSVTICSSVIKMHKTFHVNLPKIINVSWNEWRMEMEKYLKPNPSSSAPEPPPVPYRRCTKSGKWSIDLSCFWFYFHLRYVTDACRIFPEVSVYRIWTTSLPPHKLVWSPWMGQKFNCQLIMWVTLPAESASHALHGMPVCHACSMLDIHHMIIWVWADGILIWFVMEWWNNAKTM